jgi:hypothetical protein
MAPLRINHVKMILFSSTTITTYKLHLYLGREVLDENKEKSWTFLHFHIKLTSFITSKREKTSNPINAAK